MFKTLLGDAFPIIEKVAPLIAGALGSPVAGVATSAAINALGTAFGVENVGDLSTAIINHPACDLPLQTAESNFMAVMKSGAVKMPSHVELNLKIDWTIDS